MRVQFKSDGERRRFFREAQQAKNKTWVDINRELEVPRKTMDSYKSGRLCLPEELYNTLKAPNTIYNATLLPENWGESKGGKATYAKYPEEFVRRQKRGLARLAQLHPPKDWVVPDIYINEPVCELIGAFLGDGCYTQTGRLRTLVFTGDNRLDTDYYHQTIVPVLYSLVSTLYVRELQKGNTLRVVCTSNALSNIFEQAFEFSPGVKTYTVKIPWYVYEAGDSCVCACIRGIFDTDGSVFWDKRKAYKKPYPRIVLQIMSEQLYKQLVTFLSRWFSLYTTKNNRGAYVIELYGHEQLERWMALIGFSNPRHLNRLKAS